MHIFESHVLRVKESSDFADDALFRKIRLTFFEEVMNDVIDLQLISVNLLNIDAQKIDTTTADIFNLAFVLFNQHIADIFELFFHLYQSLELNSID